MAELALVAALALGVVELVTHGGLTRLAWTTAVRGAAAIDGLALSALRVARPPRFVLRGRCHRCGECCRMIVADPPRLVHETGLLSAFVLYHRLLHGFRPTGSGPAGEVLFACDHLRADGRCGIYARRPLLCRDYPVLPFFGEPVLLPACGYRVAPRSVARMRARTSLAILNPGVTVHHPTRERAGELGRDEDYEWIDDAPVTS